LSILTTPKIEMKINPTNLLLRLLKPPNLLNFKPSILQKNNDNYKTVKWSVLIS